MQEIIVTLISATVGALIFEVIREYLLPLYLGNQKRVPIVKGKWEIVCISSKEGGTVRKKCIK